MIDYSALTSPTNPDEVRGFAQWASHPSRQWTPLSRVPYGLRDSLGLVLPLVALPVALVAPLVSYSAQLGQPEALLPLVLLLFIVGAGLSVIASKARSRFAGMDWETMYRLHQFAKDNGLDYAATGKGRPPYPGQLFNSHGETYNRVFFMNENYFDIGSYRHLTGIVNDVPVYEHRGYIAVKLQKTLPQITLDATANHGMHSTLIVGGTATKVSLEGDFDRHFTLRVPPGYERDALYVLTPDLMALLIDETSNFDVELVDDWMFVYSPEPFITADPALYERLLRILSTVGAKAVSQTARYSDPRRSWVGAKGARFVRGTPLWVHVLAWVAIVAFAVSFALSFASAGGIQSFF